MAELDLVPAAYRRRVTASRLWRRFVGLEIAVLVMLAIGKGLMATQVHARAASLAQLDADRQVAQQLSAQTASLQAERRELQRQLGMLDELRGGPPVIAVLGEVDRALDGRVWFTRWKFMRAGEFVAPEPEVVRRGYILVVPEGARGGAKGQARAWRMGTHMEIAGQAVDHGALAQFIESLSNQPHVSEVKVLNTQVRRYTDRQAVGFELVVVMGEPER